MNKYVSTLSVHALKQPVHERQITYALVSAPAMQGASIEGGYLCKLCYKHSSSKYESIEDCIFIEGQRYTICKKLAFDNR